MRKNLAARFNEITRHPQVSEHTCGLHLRVRIGVLRVISRAAHSRYRAEQNSHRACELRDGRLLNSKVASGASRTQTLCLEKGAQRFANTVPEICLGRIPAFGKRGFARRLQRLVRLSEK